ncbi:hypothetical protein Dimus_023753 [Dionaea muscipula]
MRASEMRASDWNPVTRKKAWRQRGMQNDLVVTIYVEDLPEQLNRKEMHHLFSKFGVVCDVYIPFKRNWKGMRFGFVRYGCKVAADVAVQKTNGLWIGDKKLTVKLAEYSRGHQQYPGSHHRGVALMKGRMRNNTRSPMRRKQVILTFPSVELRDRTLAEGKEQLQVWFSEVKAWVPSLSMGRHREVWLSCFGVPLELWGISTFCEIGSKWGEVLAIEEDTARNLTFYCGKVKILTSCLEYINCAVNLTCEGKSCLIRVLEEQVVLVNKIVGQSDHDSGSSSSTDSERHSGRSGDFALSDQVFYSHDQSDLVKDRNHNAIALERVLACDGPQSMLRDQSVLRDQILRHGNGREDELVPSDVDDDDLASPSKGINSQHWIDEDNNGGSGDPRNSGGLIEEDAEKAADDSGSRVEDTTCNDTILQLNGNLKGSLVDSGYCQPGASASLSGGPPPGFGRTQENWAMSNGPKAQLIK